MSRWTVKQCVATEIIIGKRTVVLNEDKRIVRKDNSARNLVVLKRMALNIIRADEEFEKASSPRKRFRASWDSAYLEQVLMNM